jgi:probable addiction module antidote protein
MDKKKISSNPKKLQKKSIKVNGVNLKKHSPLSIFKNHGEIKKALSEALIDGDREAFVEILASYVRAQNISKVCQKTKLSRTVVYEAIGENGNPSLDTLCKIMSAFKDPKVA